MPIESCSLPNGKKGFRWGTKGKCYSSKKDAVRQGIAIEGSEKFKEIMSGESKADLNMTAYDFVQAGQAVDEYESCVAKISPHGSQWKILGVGGLTFSTKDAAIAYQFGASAGIGSSAGKKFDDNEYADENSSMEVNIKKKSSGAVEGEKSEGMYTNNDSPTKPHLIDDEAVKDTDVFDKKISRPKEILKAMFESMTVANKE